MNEMTEEKKNEIDLVKIVVILLKRWWILLLSAIICAAGLYVYTEKSFVPIYSANVKMYVNTSSLKSTGGTITISTGGVSANKTLINTYAVILKTHLTLDKVAEEAQKIGINTSYGQLVYNISASAVNETSIFQITVMNGDGKTAMDLANLIAKVLPKQISEVISGTDAKVVDWAVEASSTYPQTTKSAAVGVLLGLILSGVVVVLIDYFNDTIESEDFLTKTYGESIPLLTVVPDATVSGGSGYSKYGRYYGKRGYYRSRGYGYYSSSASSNNNKKK